MNEDTEDSRGFRLARLSDLIFEAGMLRKTPRQGWAFLGSGGENVAEHSFRVAFIGFILARMAGADPFRTAGLGLMHDLHEARTSDLNYVHQRYTDSRQRQAQLDACAGTGLEKDIVGLFDEFEARESCEARLAKDADQLDLIFNLRVEQELGNREAGVWLESALARLKTEEARKLARECLATPPTRWWKRNVSQSWWVDRTCDEGPTEAGK